MMRVILRIGYRAFSWWYSTTTSTGALRATINCIGSTKLSFTGWWMASGGT
jgi:hypothetical protein